MLPEGPAGPPGPEDVWQGLCLGAQTTGAEGVGSSSDSDLGCVTLGKLRNLPAPPRLHSSHCRVEGAAGELFHPITGSLRSLTAQAHLCLGFWGPRLKVRLLYHEPALLQSSLPYPVALQVVSGAGAPGPQLQGTSPLQTVQDWNTQLLVLCPSLDSLSSSLAQCGLARSTHSLRTVWPTCDSGP